MKHFKKSIAQKMRNALIRSGANDEAIKAALAVLNPPKVPTVRVTAPISARILARLETPGDRVLLILSKKYKIIVTTEAHINGASERMKKNKTWEKSSRIPRAAVAA